MSKKKPLASAQLVLKAYNEKPFFKQTKTKMFYFHVFCVWVNVPCVPLKCIPKYCLELAFFLLVAQMNDCTPIVIIGAISKIVPAFFPFFCARSLSVGLFAKIHHQFFLFVSFFVWYPIHRIERKNLMCFVYDSRSLAPYLEHLAL